MPEEIDIDRVAQLARIALTPEEKDTFSRQLGDVLAHIHQLEQVDVSGVEPMSHAQPLANVWQEDEPRAGLPLEDVLRNAPAHRSGMISVPKIID